jgi:hypothetical protein
MDPSVFFRTANIRTVAVQHFEHRQRRPVIVKSRERALAKVQALPQSKLSNQRCGTATNAGRQGD